MISLPMRNQDPSLNNKKINHTRVVKVFHDECLSLTKYSGKSLKSRFFKIDLQRVGIFCPFVDDTEVFLFT